MPIVEANLDKKLADLLEKETAIRATLQDLRNVRSNLYEIRKIVEKIDDGDGGLEDTLVVPIDRRTKKPFSATARQKIYDDNLVIANKLLA